jgi:predicted enzyme related to lactoylglutathione lyase
MSHLHGKFVWFEHMSGDTPQARKFYDALFGWHTELTPMGGAEPYPLIMNGSDGIGGYRSAPPGAPSLWMSYLSVADVEASHGAALAAGAKSLMPPTDFGPVGRGATLADPTGAVFSIWTSAQGDRPDPEKMPVGDWTWNELMSPDEHKALAFYERVFGYTHDTMDMGAQGTYYLLKKGDKMRGGLMRSPMPDTPPLWVPYVAVADCDATAAKARSLGAQLIVPPTDIPNVGRFATLLDAQGACIAWMKPAG